MRTYCVPRQKNNFLKSLSDNVVVAMYKKLRVFLIASDFAHLVKALNRKLRIYVLENHNKNSKKQIKQKLVR